MGRFLLTDLDAVQVAADALTVLKSPSDIAGKFNTHSAAAINSQETSTVRIPTEPVVTFASTQSALTALASQAGVPKDGEVLPSTSATAGSVELSLDEDEYAKVPVDRKATKSSETLTALGRATGKGIIKLGNTSIIRAAVLQGTGKAIGGTTAAKLWSTLNATVAQYDEDGYDLSEFVGVFSATDWALLSDDIANLRSAVNSKVRAAELLGLKEIVVGKVGSFTKGGTTVNAAGFIGHSEAIAQAKRVDEVRTREGDAVNYVIARVLLGSKVLVPEAVTVLTK